MIDDLCGAPIDDYILQDKVGEGSFSVVYLGVKRHTDEPRAFKIARNEVNQTASSTHQVWTQALMDATGVIVSAPVNPSVFLRKQFQYLQEAGPSLFPRVDGLVEFRGGAAMQMEFLEGLSLRELMLRSEVPDDVLLRLARTLAELEQRGLEHGDLKPENIFVTGERVVLLDPGFFGQLLLTPGASYVRVTTPEYYPSLEPQDITALGLILLELTTGVRLTRGVKEGQVGPGLAAQLEEFHMGNNYFFDSISQISGGTRGGELLAASPLQPVISKALGLECSAAGTLDLGYKYPGFAALESDLQELLGSRHVVSPGVSPADRLPANIPLPPHSQTRPEAIPLEAVCYHCGKPLNGKNACPHCGVSCVAPLCPRCGKPVSHTLDHKESFAEGNGRVAWNSDWDGRCVECGLEFASTIRIRTGHHTFFVRGDAELQEEFQLNNTLEGQSILQIRGTESVYADCDDWEYLPAIEVRVRRAVAANAGKEGEGLTKEVCVTMTLEEWNTVFEQLLGPLGVLVQRRKWSRDTT
ncbi:MAG: hypothetical protein ABSF71_37320 [Terriglobia bacterium]|jgi:serine/threonine protein kinase